MSKVCQRREFQKKVQNMVSQEQKGSHAAQAGFELLTAEGDREPLGLLPATSLVLGLEAAPPVHVARNETSCLLGKYSSTKLYPPPATYKDCLNATICR